MMINPRRDVACHVSTRPIATDAAQQNKKIKQKYVEQKPKRRHAGNTHLAFTSREDYTE
jgi:hypothetical protein